MINITRRAVFTLSLGVAATFAPLLSLAEDKVLLRLSSPMSETDQRAQALSEVFGPGVSRFATFEPHWNATLFKQNTELEAIARGNLEMSITSAQELAQFFPEWSIFTAGYVLQDADHQLAVFNDPVMDPFKEQAEAALDIKLLAPMYLGRRHVNLRQTHDELEVRTPADLKGINLRMPGTDAWQFLGRALGANPTPMAFTEVYTALQTGAVDGQDNPLPTVVDAKFYEVTNQIALTSHLVDWNFIALSKSLWDELSPEHQDVLQQAADDAATAAREAQLQKEADLRGFLESEGLDIYEPDLNAFRTTVQKAYIESDFADNWPEGTLERVNELGN